MWQSKINIWAAAIIILGALLRFYHYPLFPFSGETADEYAWSFLGASLIQEHAPASWSFFSAYENYRLPLENPMGYAPLVQPAVDHPPLFSFLPGFAHALKGEWSQMPSIKLIRFPMIILAVVNLGLFWLVSQKILHKKWALVALLLFATVPSVVFASRMALAENLLQTWVLLSILIGVGPASDHRRRMYWIILSVLALLTKTAGVILPASLLIAGWWQNKKSWLKIGTISLCIGLAAYFAYGWLINLDLFLAVIKEQSARDIGLSVLHNRWLIHPSVVEKMFFDGWLIFGLIGLLLILRSKIDKKSPLVLPLSLFLANMLFVIFTVGENTFHAWYDYTIYPILILAVGWVLMKIWQTQRWLEGWLVWILLLPVVRMSLVSLDLYPLKMLPARAILLMGGLPFFFAHSNKSLFRNWPRVTSLVLFCCLILANIIVIWKMDIYVYSKISDYYFFCEARCM